MTIICAYTDGKNTWLGSDTAGVAARWVDDGAFARVVAAVQAAIDAPPATPPPVAKSQPEPTPRPPEYVPRRAEIPVSTSAGAEYVAPDKKKLYDMLAEAAANTARMQGD
jgi:hypothetical protein